METYGKQNIMKATYLQIRNRFRITELEKKYSKFPTYVPKVKKLNMIVGGIANLLLLSPAIPAGFVVSPFVTKWMLK